MVPHTHDPRSGPFYVAITAMVSREGEVQYRMQRLEAPGSRLVQENIGLAVPTCGHLTCRLANLGAAAVDWAYLLTIDTGQKEFHAEQLGIVMGPE